MGRRHPLQPVPPARGTTTAWKAPGRFREENGGTRFDQTLDYEYNVPTLGPLVKKVIHGIVKKNPGE